jgi:protein-arginine kinase activator protein McsA
MLCQKCGLTEATVHRETIVYRQKVETHLCELCAGIGISITESSTTIEPVEVKSPEASMAISSDQSRPKELRLPVKITVRKLAELLCIKPFKAISVLMEFGYFVALTQEIDFAIAAKVCERFGIKPIPSGEKPA